MTTALDWRGNATTAEKLLAKYNVTITPGVNLSGGKVWRIVELRETHGRPELRQIVQGTDDAVIFTAITNGGLELVGLRSSLKEEGNVMNLNVKNESYYEPRKQVGPWTIFVQNVPSDRISGLGLAVDPIGDNPAMEQDNRYLALQVVWAFGSGGSVPPVVIPPVDPPVVQPPVGGATGVSPEQLAALQSLIRTTVRDEVKAAFSRAAAAV